MKGKRNMLNGIKAVLFDLDGTLVDSMWIWEDIDKLYMKKFNINYSFNELHENINGMSFTETAEFFKETFNIPDTVDAIKDEWNRMAYDYYLNRVPVKNNVIKFLDALKKRNIPMGIGTSNSRELATLVLDSHNITGYFNTIRTSCEVNKGKPNPDIYLKVAEDLGVDPKECLVFEDIPEGVLAAKRAGMKACGIFDEGSKENKDKIIQLADYYIYDYSEVLNTLEDDNDEKISAGL